MHVIIIDIQQSEGFNRDPDETEVGQIDGDYSSNSSDDTEEDEVSNKKNVCTNRKPSTT